MEACVVTLSQAIKAESLGADRVEICSHLETGGMTPDENVVFELCRQLTIPVRVMIRSTPFGFEAENGILDAMIDSIERFKKLNIDGFVFGLLKNGIVDKEAVEKLLHHSFPFPITFHKAIDASRTIPEDIKWMNEYPRIDTILTSGSALTAEEGIGKILRMKAIFRGKIMAAGKISPEQITSLHDKLRLEWYHGRNIPGELGI